MATVLDRLGAWARALRADAIPADVLRLARLQHLAGAAAVRHAAATVRGRALAAPGPEARAAALLAASGWDDHLLAARTGLAVLPVAWERADSVSVDELLVATVAGNEVGGRVGLATLLGPRSTHVAAAGPVAAAATTRAYLEGGDIGGAVAGALEALGAPPSLAEADPAWLGLESMRLGLAGAAGSRTLLDPDSPWWAEVCGHPLPGALAGEGHAWLTRTLVLHRYAAHPWLQVPLSAIDEILRRHVRAAEKRLRADQVERVAVRLALPVWSHARAAPERSGSDLAFAIGVLVAYHELTPAARDAPALEARAEEIAWVASTVELYPDWGLTLRGAAALGDALGPLLGGRLWGAYRAVRRPAKAAGVWPAWGPGDLRDLARANPLRAALRLHRPAADLGAVDLSGFAWSLPVEVKLYTTRGGWWPERRGRPSGTVAGGDLEAVALAKWEDALRAAELLAAGGSAADWVRGLRG